MKIIEILDNSNANEIIPNSVVEIIKKYFDGDGIRNKLFHVYETNIEIEGDFNDITYLIMSLVQILKLRIEKYNGYVVKEIEKL